MGFKTRTICPLKVGLNYVGGGRFEQVLWILGMLLLYEFCKRSELQQMSRFEFYLNTVNGRISEFNLLICVTLHILSAA